MIPLLCGLAAQPALPADLLERLTGLAGRVPDPDEELACALAERTDLTSGQVRALAAVESAAIRLAHAGRLDPADVDPLDRPSVALALLDEGLGLSEWARVLAAHPDRERRRQLASRPGLPLDVQETLAADPDVSVVAELGIRTTDPTLATRLGPVGAQGPGRCRTPSRAVRAGPRGPPRTRLPGHGRGRGGQPLAPAGGDGEAPRTGGSGGWSGAGQRAAGIGPSRRVGCSSSVTVTGMPPVAFSSRALNSADLAPASVVVTSTTAP